MTDTPARSPALLVALLSFLSFGAVANDRSDAEWNDPSFAIERHEIPFIFLPGEEEEIVVTAPREAINDEIRMRHAYEDERQGMHFYNRKQYSRALPFLQRAAKLGFKNAQARLAMLYFYGWGGVSKNNTRGLGWLGVAASGRTHPTIKRYYDSAIDQVPQQHLETLRVVVRNYIQEFGNENTDLECFVKAPTRSHIARLRCRFSDETGLMSSIEVASYQEHLDQYIIPPDQFDSFYQMEMQTAAAAASTSSGGGEE